MPGLFEYIRPVNFFVFVEVKSSVGWMVRRHEKPEGSLEATG
jgi:hypothetical protein